MPNPKHEQAQRALVGLLFQFRIRHATTRVDQRGSAGIPRYGLGHSIVQEPIGPPTSSTVSIGNSRVSVVSYSTSVSFVRSRHVPADSVGGDVEVHDRRPAQPTE